jgi:hypothetical protein
VRKGDNLKRGGAGKAQLPSNLTPGVRYHVIGSLNPSIFFSFLHRDKIMPRPDMPPTDMTYLTQEATDSEGKEMKKHTVFCSDGRSV